MKVNKMSMDLICEFKVRPFVFLHPLKTDLSMLVFCNLVLKQEFRCVCVCVP